jgi:hypothetical protein
MKSLRARALASALFALLCTGLPADSALAQALRPEIGKPLKLASELLRAGKAKEALAKVREAEAVPNRSAAEQLTIERMKGAAAQRAGDTATAIAAFEAASGSGHVAELLESKSYYRIEKDEVGILLDRIPSLEKSLSLRVGHVRLFDLVGIKRIKTEKDGIHVALGLV